MEEKSMTLPAIALRGLAVLPEMIQHFDISREKSVNAVENAMIGEQKVFLVAQRNPEVEEPEAEDLYQIGTIARIKQLVKIPGGLIRVMVEAKTDELCRENVDKIIDVLRAKGHEEKK